MSIVKFIIGIIVVIVIIVLSILAFRSPDIEIEPNPQPQSGMERLSPGDHVKEDQIIVTSERVKLELKDARWSKFTDTNSMDPVFDVGNNAIKIVPKDVSQINLGDIISYASEYFPQTVIHRVVEISEDEQGWYCLAKGDNNLDNDPSKIRFDKIKYITVSIVY